MIASPCPVADAPPAYLAYLALASLLIGVNAALFVFYVRARRAALSVRHVAGGVLGSFFAFIGFGCVSCGSVVLAPFLAAAGAAGFGASPYLGTGLGIAGIGLLTLSAALLARTINAPPVCPV